MRASADIIEFADDDMEFYSTYKEDVISEYRKHPEADVILFSNNCLNKDREPYKVDKFGKVNRIEAVNFGGARITARRNKLLYNNIYFSLLFGGGAKYCAGEDTTFIQDCIKAGLNVYKSPIVLSSMKQETSSWFTGYNDKYYFDKGALLERNFPKISYLGAYIKSYQHRKESGFTFNKLCKLYKNGIADYKKNK